MLSPASSQTLLRYDSAMLCFYLLLLSKTSPGLVPQEASTSVLGCRCSIIAEGSNRLNSNVEGPYLLDSNGEVLTSWTQMLRFLPAGTQMPRSLPAGRKRRGPYQLDANAEARPVCFRGALVSCVISTARRALPAGSQKCCGPSGYSHTTLYNIKKLYINFYNTSLIPEYIFFNYLLG